MFKKVSIIIVLFFISCSVYGQKNVVIFDSIIIYARTSHLPSFIDTNICRSNYVRKNNNVNVVLKGKFVKGDLFEDTICKTFLSKKDDTMFLDFSNTLLYSVVVIDFLKADSIIESISLCKFNYFIRNDDYSKVFLIKPEMTKFLKKEFYYIFNIYCDEK